MLFNFLTNGPKNPSIISLLKKSVGYWSTRGVRVKDTDRTAAQSGGSGCVHLKPLLQAPDAKLGLQEWHKPCWGSKRTQGFGDWPPWCEYWAQQGWLGKHNLCTQHWWGHYKNTTDRCTEKLEKAQRSRKTSKFERSNWFIPSAVHSGYRIPPFTDEEEIRHRIEASHIQEMLWILPKLLSGDSERATVLTWVIHYFLDLRCHQ